VFVEVASTDTAVPLVGVVVPNADGESAPTTELLNLAKAVELILCRGESV
jgi:hypothetical protein